MLLLLFVIFVGNYKARRSSSQQSAKAKSCDKHLVTVKHSSLVTIHQLFSKHSLTTKGHQNEWRGGKIHTEWTLFKLLNALCRYKTFCKFTLYVVQDLQIVLQSNLLLKSTSENL